MKKILITGAAGYVGSVLTPYLLNKGHHISALDLFIYGDTLGKHKNLNLIKGDIRDADLLDRVIPGHDVIIHLACISNDPSFELNPKLGKEINLDAFIPLVKKSKNNNIKRFIYASSSSVYGIKNEKNVTEDMVLDPLTDYSKFKADCEPILLNESSKNFETSIIRPATVCGYSPRQRLDLVVNILTNLAYHKKEISVFGGNQLRPNIHIADMVRIYENFINAEKEAVNRKIFNAGVENNSVLELAEIVRSCIGDEVKIKTVHSDDNRSYHISSQKIKKDLGFKFKFSISDAVNELKNAFENKKLKDPLDNEDYFNIKKMNKINLS